eukprot:g5596.t1
MKVHTVTAGGEALAKDKDSVMNKPCPSDGPSGASGKAGPTGELESPTIVKALNGTKGGLGVADAPAAIVNNLGEEAKKTVFCPDGPCKGGASGASGAGGGAGGAGGNKQPASPRFVSVTTSTTAPPAPCEEGGPILRQGCCHLAPEARRNACNVCVKPGDLPKEKRFSYEQEQGSWYCKSEGFSLQDQVNSMAGV